MRRPARELNNHGPRIDATATAKAEECTSPALNHPARAGSTVRLCFVHLRFFHQARNSRYSSDAKPTPKPQPTRTPHKAATVPATAPNTERSGTSSPFQPWTASMPGCRTLGCEGNQTGTAVACKASTQATHTLTTASDRQRNKPTIEARTAHAHTHQHNSMPLERRTDNTSSFISELCCR